MDRRSIDWALRRMREEVLRNPADVQPTLAYLIAHTNEKNSAYLATQIVKALRPYGWEKMLGWVDKLAVEGLGPLEYTAAALDVMLEIDDAEAPGGMDDLRAMYRRSIERRMAEGQGGDES